MSGGEPLSEELSPEVEAAIDEFSGRIFRWYSDSAAPTLPGPGEILRAFAREILQPLDKDYGELAATYRASQESCRSLQKERDELAELIECDPGDSGTPCGNCRGCARSECRSLSEALETMLDRPTIRLLDPKLAGNAWLVRVRDVQAAYRSSEAGRGKP